MATRVIKLRGLWEARRRAQHARVAAEALQRRLRLGDQTLQPTPGGSGPQHADQGCLVGGGVLASRKAKTQPARTRDGRSWQGEHECPALGSKISHRAAHLRETDCVAGHVGLELRNVVANYLFEKPHRFSVDSAEFRPQRLFAFELRRCGHAARLDLGCRQSFLAGC
jgi:hypothetical protein